MGAPTVQPLHENLSLGHFDDSTNLISVTLHDTNIIHYLDYLQPRKLLVFADR